MEWYYQGTESADEILEMPFIIVHSGLAVASLRLCETGSHVTLVARGGETEYCVASQNK